MAITHFKRLLMEVDLRRLSVDAPTLPPGYVFAGWHPVLMAPHSRVKFESFEGQIDANVFESLATLEGCQQLMRDIVHHDGFVAAATWLIRYEGNRSTEPAPCATIQGLRRGQFVGSIQNVGVVLAHRGRGLGRALVLKSLLGFRSLGIRTARLEVTAANRSAVRLYESIGFRTTRATYRSVESSTETVETH